MNDALNEWFPPDNGVTIMAEPGRFFVASAFTLATKIHSIKKRSNDDDHVMYFINDGVYGSFNSILYDHSVVMPRPLNVSCIILNGLIFDICLYDKFVFCPNQKQDYPMSLISESSIWGPTCDGLDQVVDSVNLPLMKMGDWITFEDMGAYTIPVASTFNGFPLPKIFAIANRKIWLVSISVARNISFCNVCEMFFQVQAEKFNAHIRGPLHDRANCCNH